MPNNEITPGVLGHTFKIVKPDTGFLWLGTRIATIEDGKVLQESTVYYGTLCQMIIHTEAEAMYAMLNIAGSLSKELEKLQGHKTSSLTSIPSLDAIQRQVEETNQRLPKKFQRPHTSPLVGSSPQG